MLELVQHPNIDIGMAGIGILDTLIEGDNDQTDEEVLAVTKLAKNFVNLPTFPPFLPSGRRRGFSLRITKERREK